MIVLSLDMWPLGCEERQYPLGRAYLVNQEATMMQHANRDDYLVAFCRRGSRELPKPIDPNGPYATRAGLITDYPRLSYNVWRLASRALHVGFPEESNRGTKPVIAPEVLVGLRLLASKAARFECPTGYEAYAMEWLAAADDETYNETYNPQE